MYLVIVVHPISENQRRANVAKTTGKQRLSLNDVFPTSEISRS